MQACLSAAANLIARDACLASFMPAPADLLSVAGYFAAGVFVTAYLAHLARKYLL